MNLFVLPMQLSTAVLLSSVPGSTGGPVIGDHMPPNKIVLGEKANLNKMLQEIPGLAKVCDGAG